MKRWQRFKADARHVARTLWQALVLVAIGVVLARKVVGK